MINSPCKNCGDRLVTKEYNCHSHCQKYFDYISSLEEYKATYIVDKAEEFVSIILKGECSFFSLSLK